MSNVTELLSRKTTSLKRAPPPDPEEACLPAYTVMLMREWHSDKGDMELVGRLNDALLVAIQEGTTYCGVPYGCDVPPFADMLEVANSRYELEID